MTSVHFSRKTCLWATPDVLFDALNKEFGFTLDVCSDGANAKCAKFFTPEQDGILQPWSGAVWCNPPYGNRIAEWLHKAIVEKSNGVTSVFLLPARTDTKWFHEYILGKAEIRFIKGRLKFGGAKNSGPFPSMIVIYKA